MKQKSMVYLVAVILVATVVQAGPGALLARPVARAAAKAAQREATKGAAGQTGKAVAKGAAEQAGKAAAKGTAGQVGKVVAKEAAEQAGKVVAKGTAEQVSKVVARESTGRIALKTAGQNAHKIGAGGGVLALGVGASQALQTHTTRGADRMDAWMEQNPGQPLPSASTGIVNGAVSVLTPLAWLTGIALILMALRPQIFKRAKAKIHSAAETTAQDNAEHD